MGAPRHWRGNEPKPNLIVRLTIEVGEDQPGDPHNSLTMEKMMLYTPTQLQAGFVEMAKERVDRGYQPYLLTFTYNPMGGSEAFKKERMVDEVERLYAKLLNHTFRHPRKIPVDDKPLWIYSHDWPVPKGHRCIFKRDHLFNITQNDGLHGHAMAFQPPVSRMKEGLYMHIENSQRHIHGPVHAFFRVHVEEVVDDPEYVLKYATKSLSRKRIDAGELLILPKSQSEISRYDEYDREQMKLTADMEKAARLKRHRRQRGYKT